MSKLIKYLNENHFQIDENLFENFLENFGVNIRQEENLFLFKYGLIAAKWNDITKECRGFIAKFENGEWKCKARPYDKFFNLHEEQCPIAQESSFQNKKNNLSLAEKADGSCILLWHDDKQWRVSTLGSIETGPVYDFPFTFANLFNNTVSYDEKKLNKNWTYIFELCCEDNRIVTRYGYDHAVMLGIRDRNSGLYLDTKEHISFFRNVRLPIRLSLHENDIETIQDLYELAEKESVHPMYGEYPEGFVVYENDIPIAKIKNKKYLFLHKVGGGDIKQSMNQIVDAIFKGYLDDVYDSLTKKLKHFALNIQEQVRELEAKCLHNMNEIKSKGFSTRKEVAIYVNTHIEKNIRPYFFENIPHILSEENVDMDNFEKWLQKCYNKIDWKAQYYEQNRET